MIFLLDVNVLIALVDKRHELAKSAREWFIANCEHGWATCPITENGALRILTNPRYGPNAMTIATATAALKNLRRAGDHRFWPDDISLLDTELLHDHALETSGQVTDSYLLALAIHRGGQLATFDQRLVHRAAKSGPQASHLIPV